MSYDFKTSGPAYEDAKENLNYKQSKVLDAIMNLGVCTDAQICSYLNWSINKITPRRGELVKLNKVVCDGKRRDRVTKRTVNFWKIKQAQIELFQ